MKTRKKVTDDLQTKQKREEKTLVDRMIDYMAKTEKKTVPHHNACHLTGSTKEK